MGKTLFVMGFLCLTLLFHGCAVWHKINPFEDNALPHITIHIEQIEGPEQAKPGDQIGLKVAYTVKTKHWKKKRPMTVEEVVTLFYEGLHWKTLAPIKNDRLHAGVSWRSLTLTLPPEAAEGTYTIALHTTLVEPTTKEKLVSGQAKTDLRVRAESAKKVASPMD